MGSCRDEAEWHWKTLKGCALNLILALNRWLDRRTATGKSPDPTGTVLQKRAHTALFSFLSILAIALPAFPISPLLLNFLICHCLSHYQDLQGPSTSRAFRTDPKQFFRQEHQRLGLRTEGSSSSSPPVLQRLPSPVAHEAAELLPFAAQEIQVNWHGYNVFHIKLLFGYFIFLKSQKKEKKMRQEKMEKDDLGFFCPFEHKLLSRLWNSGIWQSPTKQR